MLYATEMAQNDQKLTTNVIVEILEETLLMENKWKTFIWV